MRQAKVAGHPWGLVVQLVLLTARGFAPDQLRESFNQSKFETESCICDRTNVGVIFEEELFGDFFPVSIVRTFIAAFLHDNALHHQRLGRFASVSRISLPPNLNIAHPYQALTSIQANLHCMLPHIHVLFRWKSSPPYRSAKTMVLHLQGTSYEHTALFSQATRVLCDSPTDNDLHCSNKRPDDRGCNID